MAFRPNLLHKHFEGALNLLLYMPIPLLVGKIADKPLTNERHTDVFYV